MALDDRPIGPTPNVCYDLPTVSTVPRSCTWSEPPIGPQRSLKGCIVSGSSEEEVLSESHVLLSDEAPIHEMDELRGLIAEGQEKGSLGIEQITACLEEVEVTKEQVQE